MKMLFVDSIKYQAGMLTCTLIKNHPYAPSRNLRYDAHFVLKHSLTFGDSQFHVLSKNQQVSNKSVDKA